MVRTTHPALVIQQSRIRRKIQFKRSTYGLQHSLSLCLGDEITLPYNGKRNEVASMGIRIEGYAGNSQVIS